MSDDIRDYQTQFESMLGTLVEEATPDEQKQQVKAGAALWAKVSKLLDREDVVAVPYWNYSGRGMYGSYSIVAFEVNRAYDISKPLAKKLANMGFSSDSYGLDQIWYTRDSRAERIPEPDDADD